MTTAHDPNEWMSQEIFKKLSGLGHRVFMYDSSGKRVFDPGQSNRLFSDDAKMMITLDWTKGKPAKPRVTFHTSESTDPAVLDEIKTTLKKHNLFDHSFDTMPYGKTLKPKQFSHMNQEPVTESAWTGSTRTSRWRVGMTEVVIRHNQRLDDSDNARRWTRIADIFIHGPDGSRYRFPFRHILGAKAMAQHMDQGNQPWDDHGQALARVLSAVMQMRKLKRWAQVHHAELLPHIQPVQHDLKNLLQKVSHSDGYHAGIDHANHLSQVWSAAPEQPDVFPAGTDLAVAALNLQPQQQEPQPLDGEPEPMTMIFKEARELDSWFEQFSVNNIFEADPTTEIMAASAETGSTDPRTILDNLSKNVTGWESRFEENPMEVLAQIETVLAQIKNLED